MRKIIVIGATGMIGKPVTRELIKVGFDVTLAVRNIKKARQVFPLANLVRADVFDKESLQKAFKGQDIVYISLNNPRKAKPSDPLPEKEGISNIIEVAKEAGLQRIAYLSSMIMQYNGMNGYRWWLFSIKHSAVEQVKKSGLPYSIFYPSSFMETLDHQMLRGNNILLAGKSKAPMWFISGEDYGRQVAWSFRKLTIENREYPVQGLEAFTFDQAAAIFKSSYLKANLRILKAPLPFLELFGNFNRNAQYGYKIMQALNNFPEKFESQQTWEELGKPTITLEDYARQAGKLALKGTGT
ncbi:MAG: NAD(P)H-binding protein [Chitinophagaceae bacterium]